MTDDKEQVAMERLRLGAKMSEKLYHKPLLLTDSGGKDSAVICRLAENAGIPFEIVHSHTTADAPETVYHVRKRAKEYEERGILYTIHMPVYKGRRTSMWDLIPQKFIPPTRVARYCCAVLKETTGRDRFIVTGVRWAESVRRASNRGGLEVISSTPGRSLILNADNDEHRQLFESCQMKGQRVCNPIIDWTDRDVWDYLTEQKVEVNPLYCEGFHRVGCVGCPMAGRHRYKEFNRWPKYKQNYIRAFDRMLEARKANNKDAKNYTKWGHTGEDVFHWWMEDGVLPGQIDIFEGLEDYDED
jgi:3'-phosphoadenosine 5'-phosphosulfate sulfotransferase (PAPS reductase)/FAD synthetase